MGDRRHEARHPRPAEGVSDTDEHAGSRASVHATVRRDDFSAYAHAPIATQDDRRHPAQRHPRSPDVPRSGVLRPVRAEARHDAIHDGRGVDPPGWQADGAAASARQAAHATTRQNHGSPIYPHAGPAARRQTNAARAPHQRHALNHRSIGVAIWAEASRQTIPSRSPLARCRRRHAGPRASQNRTIIGNRSWRFRA